MIVIGSLAVDIVVVGVVSVAAVAIAVVIGSCPI